VQEGTLGTTLEGWNFQDDVMNGSPGSINRQKSAANLVVIRLDHKARTGVFLDHEKGTQSTTSLTTCDCRDFQFVGRVPRKTLQPCKHVYRLAMELGLLAAKYLDHEAREAIRARSVADQKRAEDERIVSLGYEAGQWGQWPEQVHRSGLQVNRQYRAYFILEDEAESVHQEGARWRVRDYAVELDLCECADFEDRRLPCKHIYVVALQSGVTLPYSRAEYVVARQEGREIIFAFQVDRRDPLTRAEVKVDQGGLG
jgi:predicted nucleic acid-binding Zn finger protein